MMSMNDTHSLERTLDYCDKSNDSFLNTTDCSLPNNISNISTVTMGCQSNVKAMSNHQQPQQQPQPIDNKRKSHIHFNRLWSVWYGILVTLFQGYLIILGLQKYLGCSLLKWKNGLPVTELNMQLIFCGLTLLFLPLFLASALFKVGNLANDGIKLSARKGTCSSEQPVIFEDDGNSSTMRSLWMHGVPISVFIHIITALCLLLPHLLLEAKLIQNQHLPKDNIWKSEIDFILNRNDRLVILSFINTSPYQNDTATGTHENKYEDDDDDSIDSLDYELNPFETHESLQSYNKPTDTYLPTLLDSIPIRISTYSDDYDFFIPDIKTTTTTMATTTRRPITTTESTTFSTTSTEPTTMSTSTLRTTSTTESTTTTEMTLPTTSIISTSTPKTTLSTIPYTFPTIPTFATFPPISERVHHVGKGSRAHGKSRKHNHKKHHRQHPPPTHEIDDLPDDPNLEIKPEKDFDFDSLDREIHMIDNGSNRSNGRKKTKGSGIVKTSSEPTRAVSRHYDQMERPKSTQKTSTDATRQIIGKVKGKDSEIHVVKSPETVPSTSSSFAMSGMRNDELKATERRLLKRSISEDDVLLLDNTVPSINEDVFLIKDEKGDEIYAAALIHAETNFSQSNELDGIGGFIQKILGTDDKFDPKHWFQKSPNLEYLNLALALLVWSVRYPSVFWESSKSFTMIFSLQMIINSIDILMLHVGTSILFKLQIVGQFMTVQNQPSPLLLNGIVTLALTLLAYVLIVASSMILYLYGHSRLSAKIRDCQMITLKDGDLWSYFSHCASLCFILAISVVKAPIIHDLSVVYRISLDKTIFASTMTSIIHIFLWIVIWLGLTAKRQWAFKLPLVESIYQTRAEAVQPLITSNGRQLNGSKKDGEETIYWPSSPKLKVTFTDEVSSTLTERNLIPDIIEHDGKRSILSTICPNGNNSGETDEGEYATLKTTTQLQISEYDEVINLQRIQHNSNDNGYDDTSEEGKLLESVRDESVTYASTRDLEPPQTTQATVYTHERYVVSSEHHMISPMAPVSVQIHSEHLTSTPRFLRRADSGMPVTNNEALTPKSDTNSTESSTSPPERALSESSSGVHSSEENKDEVTIRNKPGVQKTVKAPAVIEEEPYGRITNNHKMISFKDSMNNVNSSNTLPHNRSGINNEPSSIIDYSQCNTMPLMPGAHQIHRLSATDSPKQRTTLPNNIRYSTAGYHLRQMPQMTKNADSPYATTGIGLGNGHHTFSQRLIQNEPLPAPPIQQTHIIPQSQSQQQFSMTSSSSIYQPVHHFNAQPSTAPTTFAGLIGHNPYQMVVNELCANNHQANHSFPPPPPPISNSLQMH